MTIGLNFTSPLSLRMTLVNENGIEVFPIHYHYV